MNLPDDFQFSQSSLQDFVDCPRRFYLRYIRQLRYPAPESEPLRDFDAAIERGERFHRLVQQHQLGLPADVLEAVVPDDTVGAWWENYRAYGLTDLPPKRFSEITLTVPFAGRRLVAKYDLLAFGDRALIVDWKTALHRPKRECLQRRLQTIVYPYVLAQAGMHLNNDQTIAPEAITMIYWFAEYPQQTETFTYSADQFAQDGAYLESLAADIQRRGESDFELTENTDLCRFCAYRSLNQRGTNAGNFLSTDQQDEDGPLDFALNLDQIAEIEF